MALRLATSPYQSPGEIALRRWVWAPAAPPPACHICATGGLIVRRVGADETLVAVRAFEAGEPVFAFAHVTWRGERDALTVEDPRGRHVFDPLLARVAHSCDPNCRPSFDLMALIARRDISPGETLAFDYLATESALCAPFDCGCGARACRGRIERAGPARGR